MSFLWNYFWGKILMTFLISMVPVIELRGAIPIATAAGLDFWIAVLVAIIGNLLPIPFIIMFIRKIFEWMKQICEPFRKLVCHFEKKADKHSEKVRKYKFWGLFIFVAIPLPGTGAWTGALIAAMLDMKLKDAFPSIAFGVVCAAAIVSIVTLGAFKIF